MRVGEYTSKYVREYLTSDWWKELKDKLIYQNPQAKCFICEKRIHLLLHHVLYRNLGKEQLLKIHLFYTTGDVVVLCFDCHIKVHFIMLFRIWKIKVPLVKYLLVKYMILLRLEYLLKKRRLLEGFVTFLFYLF